MFLGSKFPYKPLSPKKGVSFGRLPLIVTVLNGIIVPPSDYNTVKDC